MTECPSCQKQSKNTEVCDQCGIIFSKWKSRPAPSSIPAPAQRKTSASKKPLWIGLLAVVVGIVIFVPSVRIRTLGTKLRYSISGRVDFKSNQQINVALYDYSGVEMPLEANS